MNDAADLSRADVRRALRALPPARRRALARAVREGRAVHDPRDAALAVAWAQRAQATSWPGWLLPRKRPHGRRALLWLLHATWIVLVVVGAIVVPAWRAGGVLRWIVMGALACSIVSLPWLFALTLRLRWNARTISLTGISRRDRPASPSGAARARSCRRRCCARPE